MKTILILPAIVLGAASLAMSTAVIANTNTHQTKPVNPVTGLVNATGSVITGVGHVTLGAVGGVAQGTAYVLNGVAHTTSVLSGGHTKVVHHQTTRVKHQ